MLTKINYLVVLKVSSTINNQLNIITYKVKNEKSLAYVRERMTSDSFSSHELLLYHM